MYVYQYKILFKTKLTHASHYGPPFLLYKTDRQQLNYKFGPQHIELNVDTYCSVALDATLGQSA